MKIVKVNHTANPMTMAMGKSAGESLSFRTLARTMVQSTSDSSGHMQSFNSWKIGRVEKRVKLTSVRQRQSPQPQITSGVRNAVQTELNSMNTLVNHDFAKVEVLIAEEKNKENLDEHQHQTN